MNIPVNKHLTVQLEQPEGAGTAWVVRVYRRKFPFRKLISSDWFLDEAQARRFAEQIAEALRNGTDPQALQRRKPGWTLLEPSAGTR